MHEQGCKVKGLTMDNNPELIPKVIHKSNDTEDSSRERSSTCTDALVHDLHFSENNR